MTCAFSGIPVCSFCNFILPTRSNPTLHRHTADGALHPPSYPSCAPLRQNPVHQKMLTIGQFSKVGFFVTATDRFRNDMMTLCVNSYSASQLASMSAIYDGEIPSVISFFTQALRRNHMLLLLTAGSTLI